MKGRVDLGATRAIWCIFKQQEPAMFSVPGKSCLLLLAYWVQFITSNKWGIWIHQQTQNSKIRPAAIGI